MIAGQSPGMSTNKFAIKKRSVNASTRNDTISGLNGMGNSTHMTASNVSASNQGGFAVQKNDSMFHATNSSFLQGGAQSLVGGGATQTEANTFYQSQNQGQNNRRIKVVSTNEESAFDSKRPDRLSIYRAKVFPEAPLAPLRLELQRDMKVTNKLFIMLRSADGLD